MDEESLYKQLRAPFEIRFISWRINNYNSDRTKAMVTFHIDARAVQHRLNNVLGVDGWSFSYSELNKESGVHGKLTVYFKENENKETGTCDRREVTREDVGYPSTTAKAEWYKDAVSDALKRCAVHFGVGHFLYALPTLWINLKVPGQKYLTDDQDDFCREWLQEQLNKMTGGKKVEVRDKKQVARSSEQETIR